MWTPTALLEKIPQLDLGLSEALPLDVGVIFEKKLKEVKCYRAYKIFSIVINESIHFQTFLRNNILWNCVNTITMKFFRHTFIKSYLNMFYIQYMVLEIEFNLNLSIWASWMTWF